MAALSSALSLRTRVAARGLATAALLMCTATFAAVAAPPVVPHPLPVASPENYAIDFESVVYADAHALPAAPDHARPQLKPGASIHTRLSFRPLVLRPAVSQPRIRYSRILGAHGEDLLAGAEIETGNLPRHRAAPFRFPVVAYGAFDSAYGDDLHWAESVLRLPRLPAGIRLMEGEVEFEVVTEEVSRLYLLSGEPRRFEPHPGFVFSVDPNGGGQGMMRIACAIDRDRAARHAGGRMPVLNLVQIRDAQQARTVLLFHSLRPGEVPAGDDHAVVLPGAGSMLFVHLVLATETVRIPFTIEDLPITRSPRAHSPLPPAEPVHIAVTDGLELALTGVEVTGGLGRLMMAPPRPSVVLDLSTLDRRGGRIFGRFPRVEIHEITDALGERVGDPSGMMMRDEQGTLEWHRFVPRPAIPADAGVPDVAGHQLLRLRVPFRWLPARIGRIRGELVVPEVTKDLVIEIPLNEEAVHEPAPGVRIEVRPPAPPAPQDARTPQHREDWCTVHLRFLNEPDAAVYPRLGDPPVPDAPLPWLNMVQFIRHDGTPLRHLSPPVQLIEGGAICKLGEGAFQMGARAARLHIVLETREFRLPFEFTDLPLIDR